MPAALGPGEPLIAARPTLVARTIDDAAALLYERRRDLVARVIDVLRSTVPAYEAALGAGEPLEAVTAGIVDLLIRCLSADGDAILREISDGVRSDGRRRCEQGIPLETLMEVLSIHKAGFMGEFEDAAAGDSRDGAVIVAQRRLDYLFERLSLKLTQGYFDSVERSYQVERRELRGLIGVSRAVTSSLELPEIAEAGLRETVRALDADAAALWIAGPRNSLVLAHSVGLQPDQEAALAARKPERSRRIANALRSETPVSLSAGDAIPRIGEDREVVVAPLRSKGSLVGMLAVARFGAGPPFEPRHVSFTGAVADHFAIAIEHVNQHRREARTDYLTGLANRPEFERAIARAIAAADRHQRPLSLLMIDLDHLKTINDEHGHNAGDDAIRAVAEVIQQQVRASDTCARMGGDEFAVAMPESGRAQAEEVAERIRQALAALSESGRLPAPVEVSIGYAERAAGVPWKALFQAADQALYREKRRRKRAARSGP